MLDLLTYQSSKISWKKYMPDAFCTSFCFYRMPTFFSFITLFQFYMQQVLRFVGELNTKEDSLYCYLKHVVS